VLLRHRVDGFMIAPSNPGSKVLRDLVSKISIPVVALDRPIAGSTVPSVVTDNFAGAKFATRHLMEPGYKRIVCLTGEMNLYTIQERMRGYRKAMESAGLECVIDTSIKDHESAEQAIGAMFSGSNRPDAILTLKNSTTIDTFEALRKRKISVPGTVALLGYDDFQLAGTVRPSISVIQQPIEAIGRVAAELLFERLSGFPIVKGSAKLARPMQVQLKTRFVQRSSCGC